MFPYGYVSYMKKINQLKDFFKKPNFYGVVHRKQNSSPRVTGVVTISIKIFEVNFGKSVLDNSKWDKIIEG